MSANPTFLPFPGFEAWQSEFQNLPFRTNIADIGCPLYLFIMLRVVCYLGVGNFLAFIVIDMMLGGDALSGRILNGHYYLGNHGIYTEVSRVVFIYSACHTYSALIGLAIAFAAVRRWKRLNPGKVG